MEILTYPDAELAIKVLPDVATYWLLYIGPQCVDIACILKDIII